MAEKTHEDVFNEIKEFLEESTNIYDKGNSVVVKEDVPGYFNTLFIVDNDHYTALEVMTGLQYTYTIKLFYGVKADFSLRDDDSEAVIDRSVHVKGNDFIVWGSDGTFWGDLRWKFKGRNEEQVKENLLQLLLDWESGEIKRK